jgi:hypothetical protein
MQQCSDLAFVLGSEPLGFPARPQTREETHLPPLQPPKRDLRPHASLFPRQKKKFPANASADPPRTRSPNVHPGCLYGHLAHVSGKNASYLFVTGITKSYPFSFTICCSTEPGAQRSSSSSGRGAAAAASISASYFLSSSVSTWTSAGARAGAATNSYCVLLVSHPMP